MGHPLRQAQLDGKPVTQFTHLVSRHYVYIQGRISGIQTVTRRTFKDMHRKTRRPSYTHVGTPFFPY